MRVSVLTLTVCLAATPCLGWADQAASAGGPPAPEVVATAAGAPAAPTQTDASLLTRWLKDAPPVASLGEDDQTGVIQLEPDRRMHGEVGFGVGTGGYRDAFAAVSLPVGQTGRLGVAVEDSQFSRPWRSERRSLDVDLSLGRASATPADCGSSFRVGDHYVEPLWATRIRGSALQDVDPRCTSADLPPR